MTTALSSWMVLRKVLPPFIPDAPLYRQKGPLQAPVVLVEFSDFQCPSCGAAVEPMRQIQKMFPDKIRIVFKHWPWSFHRWAKDAALAAECAGHEGKFWEYHDLLYARQSVWAKEDKAPDLFVRYAQDLGLNPKQFSQCLSDPSTLAIVDADIEEGREHWIQNTPTFFINGVRFVGLLQLRSYGLNQIERTVKSL